ncbi:four-helix bundle copper-binding protein [Oligoflexus tunisiensis]|uniref:four-helix bundle copper-binding protein n=1 Tax=Oligoflexus tunisiensis TaxID=708132 RepID=UPI00114D307B|nr:four-helix bundle copper-binding protein [Oligoflexus tunisiensis]
METQIAAGINEHSFQNILKSVNDDMQVCIQNCLTCHQTCEQIMVYCLERGSVYAAPGHIKTFRDCAATCALTADFLIRGSDFHTRICSVCAELCTACAEICERMSDDAMMEKCADVCHRCAASCRQMGTYQH